MTALLLLAAIYMRLSRFANWASWEDIGPERDADGDETPEGGAK